MNKLHMAIQEDDKMKQLRHLHITTI